MSTCLTRTPTRSWVDAKRARARRTIPDARRLSRAEADRLVEDLRHDLLDAGPDIEVEPRQEDPTNQDFGALVLSWAHRVWWSRRENNLEKRARSRS